MILCHIELATGQQQAVDRLASEIASLFEDFCSVRVLSLKPTLTCVVEFASSDSADRLASQSSDSTFSWANISFERVQGNSFTSKEVASKVSIQPSEENPNKTNMLAVSHQTTVSDGSPRCLLCRGSAKCGHIDLCPPSQLTIKDPLRVVKTSVDSSNRQDTLTSFLVRQDISVAPFENCNTRFILVSNFDSSKLRAKPLANLLGCYGNVNCIAVSQWLGAAFVELDCARGVSRVCQYLNKFPAFGSGLHIQKLAKEFSFAKLLAVDQAELSVVYPPPKLHRFKSNLEIRLNSPANLLHFTNVDSSLDVALLYMIVSLVQEPRSIYLLSKRVHGSRMYLIEFEEASQAAEVLAVLHNKQVGEKLLKVSFSHARVGLAPDR